MSKIIFSVVYAILVCSIGFLAGRLTYNIKDNKQMHYCLVKPLVYDAYTGEPLANATVTNTADGKTYTTAHAWKFNSLLWEWKQANPME